ncbi:unnamed protein product [Dracunculus medinensis]|uniref:Protein kinase domain-containing protein n=1 Tax=Dracunculus medinensis TaxID=318479 RepID=A0A0N4UKT8_DRAME|nr:unnamed protein product [Dracunculus medinensis]
MAKSVKCNSDEECEIIWPRATCRNRRCVCPENSIRKRSHSYGWVCLSLLDASTGMLGPPLTCPLPEGAGFRTIFNKDSAFLCQSKQKNHCQKGYECIQGIGYSTNQGDGVCCPTRENACRQICNKSNDGWILRWYFDGIECRSFLWNPEKNSTANNFTTKTHYGKSVCMPAPDSIYPYKKRLNFLKKGTIVQLNKKCNIDLRDVRLTSTELDHLLLDDMFIELTDNKLGQGAVGFVFKGYVYAKTKTRFKQKVFAAVKMSYPMPQKSMGLLDEAFRMSKLDHPNIVKLIAVSKLSFEAFRPMIAMEWLPGGSLAEYFRNHIRKNENAPLVYVRDIVHILRQVAQALKYLHESVDDSGYDASHGDVAARNVLLASTNLRCQAKLGDFGIPIDFGPRLPIPWLPPEIVSSLDRTRIIHRPESDVWMFGVLGWECATLGAEPHYQRTVDEIQQCFTWPDRGLHRPPSCPLDFWNFLMDCMSEQHRRPRFAGSVKTVSSAIYRLEILRITYERNDQIFTIYNNISNCTCHQHRCNIPLPSFSCKC